MQPSEAIAIESALALATRFHNQQRDSDGDPYILHLLAQYILKLAEDPVATEVKMADLQDNYRIDRVKYRSDFTSHDALRLQRYILSHRFLRNEIDRDAYTQAMQNLE